MILITRSTLTNNSKEWELPSSPRRCQYGYDWSFETDLIWNEKNSVYEHANLGFWEATNLASNSFKSRAWLKLLAKTISPRTSKVTGSMEPQRLCLFLNVYTRQRPKLKQRVVKGVLILCPYADFGSSCVSLANDLPILTGLETTFPIGMNFPERKCDEEISAADWEVSDLSR